MEGANKDVEKQSLIGLESFKSDTKGNVKLEPTFDEKEPWDIKLVAFVVIGVITSVFVIAEIGVALYLDSLVLISDGFHNLSDVVSLYIAYWAQKAQKRDISNDMTYGWARTEIIGGLTNGCFLVSLCFYVLLESIPKFIRPEPMESGTWFLVVAGVGLAVNTIGTIVFALTGNAHGHSHAGGGGHSHSHGGSDKKKTENDHGHSHSGGEHGHSHEHGEKKSKKEKKEKHSHSHSHSGGSDHGHSHDAPAPEKKARRDMNVHAVFLHYLGDALSSVLVLIAGFLLKWFDGQTWTLYIDPVSSLVIVVLIMWTTLPLVKRCSIILLQTTPDEVNMESLRKKMSKIEGLLSLHDLHVWQLVDGMFISSVHVSVEEGVDFAPLSMEIKKVFHEAGIHSTSIQPEFIPRSQPTTIYCLQNCVPKCDEEWCCAKTAKKVKKWGVELQSFSPKSDHV